MNSTEQFQRVIAGTQRPAEIQLTVRQGGTAAFLLDESELPPAFESEQRS